MWKDVSSFAEIVICMVRHKKICGRCLNLLTFFKVTEDLQENQQVLRCDILLQYPGLEIYKQKRTRTVAETGRRRQETV